MFLQLDTVVECYLITNFFFPFNFAPYHVVSKCDIYELLMMALSTLEHSSTTLILDSLSYSARSLHSCGADDVTNEKFIVAGKSFQTIRHIINGGMEDEAGGFEWGCSAF